MKKLFIGILIAFFALTASAQKLIDIYKSGTVRLIPDPEFAQGNNWNEVFESYSDTMYGKSVGNKKSLIIMPDGSIIVNHKYRNYYSKFSPNGKFEKEIGIRNSAGKQIKEPGPIEGIINNNTFFTKSDKMGKILCLDFNGNLKKTLTLDYSTHQMIALPNNKIAVVGWSIWANKFRDFVSIVNPENNEEEIIWDHFTSRTEIDKDSQNNKINNPDSKKVDILSIIGTPDLRGISISPQIAIVGNQLIIAIQKSGEIVIYDLEKKSTSKMTLDFPKNYMSVEEQKEIQQNAIDNFKNLKIPAFVKVSDRAGFELKLKERIKAMEAGLKEITEPIALPAFSTIIQDSDGNILFFEYPKEDNMNKFNVWVLGDDNKFVCQSSFVCDEYDLQINPSKMVFYNGYIYGLQIKKGSAGTPLRLVRFKLASNKL